MTSARDTRTDLAFQIWNEGGLAAHADQVWAEDIVWEEARRFPGAGVHRGRAACVARMGERLALLGEVKIEVVGAQRFDDNRLVLIEMIVRGQGTTSGVPTEMREFYLSEIRDGRVVRLREFLERDEAVAAVEEEKG